MVMRKLEECLSKNLEKSLISPQKNVFGATLCNHHPFLAWSVTMFIRIVEFLPNNFFCTKQKFVFYLLFFVFQYFSRKKYVEGCTKTSGNYSKWLSAAARTKRREKGTNSPKSYRHVTNLLWRWSSVASTCLHRTISLFFSRNHRYFLEYSGVLKDYCPRTKKYSRKNTKKGHSSKTTFITIFALSTLQKIKYSLSSPQQQETK